MQVYLVGGAVRDHLLHLPPKDHDYVVVNSSPDEMTKNGFIRVGASYDVYLHPQTKEEYVLAADLTADLKRRDLTMNSMAEDEKGNLIDPFGGKKDLEAKILRHTSDHFSEDPLRIYRLARFRAQWPEFSIHPETITLARALAQGSAFRELHGNRVFNEFRNALEAKRPSEFFSTLEMLKAKTLHFSAFEKTEHIENLPAEASLRFAGLCLFLLNEEDVKKVCVALTIPNQWQIEALAALRCKKLLDQAERSPEEVVAFFYAIDVFRRKDLVRFLLRLFGPSADFLAESFQKIKGVTAEDKTLKGRQIAEEIRTKRVEILKRCEV